METDGRKERYLAKAVRRKKEHQSIQAVVDEYLDVIEDQLKSRVPLEVITADLRDDFDLQIKSKQSVKSCILRARDKRKKRNNTKKSAAPAVDMVFPSKITEPKKTSKPKPRKKSVKADYEECPYILKIEAHLKKRLPDSLRPYIKIVNGKPVTSFEKGTIRTAETRELVRKIWNICDEKVVLKD